MRSPGRYSRLKGAVDGGDASARERLYYEVLRFEWISAALAFGAFAFDWRALSPSLNGLAATSFGSWLFSLTGTSGASFWLGILAGSVLAGLAIGLLLSRRRNATRAAPLPRPRLLPDFTYLLPTTLRERALFAAVALSAGICEEVVARAWLLATLHGFALSGWPLVLIASALFGFGHYYQGLAGVVVTFVLGIVFCALFVATGSLVVPIIVHALLDLRAAFVSRRVAPA